MIPKFTKAQRFWMANPIIQAFRLLYLSIKVLTIVAGGHGGTRK
jgi:hypothetical protein